MGNVGIQFRGWRKRDAGRRLVAPAAAAVHHNDNRPDRRLAAVTVRPQRVACGRLSLEPTVSAARWQAAIHLDAEGRQSLGPRDPQAARQNRNAP
jgi:hypothetical protein